MLRYSSLSLLYFPSSLLLSSGLMSGRFEYSEDIKYFYIKLYHNKYYKMLSFSFILSVHVKFKLLKCGK